jgi:hypothetical protein
MAMRFANRVYLFEFKIVENAPDGSALAQLKDRNYAAPYLAEGKPIHLIGVEFSKTARTIVAWNLDNI